MIPLRPWPNERLRSPDENAAEEWRAYLDIDDDLPVFCSECAEREFGGDRAGRGNRP